MVQALPINLNWKSLQVNIRKRTSFMAPTLDFFFTLSIFNFRFFLYFPLKGEEIKRIVPKVKFQ